MQFFTVQRWQRLQDSRDATIDEEWNQAFAAYFAQLEGLRDRLTEQAFFFFRDADVHDGELMQLSVVDGSRPAPLNEAKRRWASPRNFPLHVDLTVLDAWDRFLWTVSYTGVRRLLTDFPGEQQFRYQDGEGFGDWGYHELVAATDACMRHEILFASGSTILIEFDQVTVSVKQARGETGPLPFYRKLSAWERGLILHMLTVQFPGCDVLVQNIDNVLCSSDGAYYDNGGLVLRAEPDIRIETRNRAFQIDGEGPDENGSRIHYRLEFFDGEMQGLDIYRADGCRVRHHPDFKDVKVRIQ